MTVREALVLRTKVNANVWIFFQLLQNASIHMDVSDSFGKGIELVRTH